MEMFLSPCRDMSFKGRLLSSFGQNVFIKDPRRPLSPSMRFEKESLMGVDGELVFVDGFKNLNIVVEIVNANPNFATRIAENNLIGRFFQGKGELYFSDSVDVKYEALALEISTPVDEELSSIFSISFDCKPLFNSEGGSSLVNPGGGISIDVEEIKADIQQIKLKNTEQDTALAGKVDKVEGKGLSEANYTQVEKDKLAGLTSGGGYDDTALSGRVTTIESNQTAHITNQDIHVSVAEKTQWNAKVDTSALTEYRLKADKITESDLATEVQTKLSTHTTLKNFYVELDTGKPQPNFEDGFGQEHLRSILLLDGDGVLTLYGEVPDFNLKKIGGPDRICVLHFTFNQWLVLDGTANFIFLSSGQQYKPQTGDTLIFRMKNGVAYEIARFNSQKNLVQSDNVKEIKIENGKLMIYDGQAWHENQGGGGVGRLDSVGLAVIENTYEEGIISGI